MFSCREAVFGAEKPTICPCQWPTESHHHHPLIYAGQPTLTVRREAHQPSHSGLSSFHIL